MTRLTPNQHILLKYLNLVGISVGEFNSLYVDLHGNSPFHPSLVTSINNKEFRSYRRSFNSFRQGSSNRSQYEPIPETWTLSNHYLPRNHRNNPAPAFNFELYRSQFETTMKVKPRTMKKSKAKVTFAGTNKRGATATFTMKVPKTTLHSPLSPSPPAHPPNDVNGIVDPEHTDLDPNWSSAHSFSGVIPSVGPVDFIWKPTLDKDGNAYSGPYAGFNTIMNWVPYGASKGHTEHNTLIITTGALSLESISRHVRHKTYLSPCNGWVIFEFTVPIKYLAQLMSQNYIQTNSLQRLGKEANKDNRKRQFNRSLKSLSKGKQVYTFAVKVPDQVTVQRQLLQGKGLQSHELSTESLLCQKQMPCEITGRDESQTVAGLTVTLSVGDDNDGAPDLHLDEKVELAKQRATEKMLLANARRIQGHDAGSDESEEEEDSVVSIEHFNLSDNDDDDVGDDDDGEEDDDVSGLTSGVSKMNCK